MNMIRKAAFGSDYFRGYTFRMIYNKQTKLVFVQYLTLQDIFLSLINSFAFSMGHIRYIRLSSASNMITSNQQLSELIQTNNCTYIPTVQVDLLPMQLLSPGTKKSTMIAYDPPIDIDRLIRELDKQSIDLDDQQQMDDQLEDHNSRQSVFETFSDSSEDDDEQDDGQHDNQQSKNEQSTVCLPNGFRWRRSARLSGIGLAKSKTGTYRTTTTAQTNLDDEQESATKSRWRIGAAVSTRSHSPNALQFALVLRVHSAIVPTKYDLRLADGQLQLGIESDRVFPAFLCPECQTSPVTVYGLTCSACDTSRKNQLFTVNGQVSVPFRLVLWDIFCKVAKTYNHNMNNKKKISCAKRIPSLTVEQLRLYFEQLEKNNRDTARSSDEYVLTLLQNMDTTSQQVSYDRFVQIYRDFARHHIAWVWQDLQLLGYNRRLQKTNDL